MIKETLLQKVEEELRAKCREQHNIIEGRFCPLMSTPEKMRNCCGDRCGWYNKKFGSCAIVLLSDK